MADGDAALRKALAEAQAALDGLTRTNSDLTRRAEASAAELRAVTEERNRLREQLAAARVGPIGPGNFSQVGAGGVVIEGTAAAAQIAALERILAATRRELEACGTARTGLATQFAEAQASAEASARQLEPLQAELRRSAEAAAKAAAEIAAHLRRAADLTAERDQARARVTELDKEAAGLRKALADCEAAGAKLSRDNAALARQAEGAAAQLQACVAERGALTERLKAETARTAALTAELKACSAERERLSGQAGKQAEKLAALAAQIETCTAAREKLTAELADAQARAEAAAKRLEDLDANTGRAAELEKEAAALRKALAACEAAGAKLVRDNAAATKGLERATAQLQACTATRDKLTDDLAEARGQADSAAHRLKVLEAELGNAAQARAKAEADLANCTGQTSELRESMRQTAAALEACRLAAAEAERRAGEADKARLALDDRLLALQTESGLRDSELDELREQLSGDRVYVNRLKETMVAETAKASMAVQQLEAVREQHRSAIPTADLVSNLATSFDAVNRQLLSSASSYRLGRTDFTLKTFLGEGGSVAFMPDAAHLVDNRALSEISIELIPDDTPKAPAAGALVVPDLLGLTETAVIRIVSSLFLKADKAVETVAAQEKHGRALRQIPAPGTPAARGQTVLVIYGAKEGE